MAQRTSGGVFSRRKTALQYLKNQLKTGQKPTKEGSVPLSDKDIERIKKEITTLQSRI